MTEFRYLTAAEWGMRWAGAPIAERQPDPLVAVHHSAGAHVDDAIRAFVNLNEYAINTKGYRALDYDYLVHRSKSSGVVTIGEGRGKYMSAATLDLNEEAEAVCVLGYFQPGHALSRRPHPDEIEGCARAIAYGVDRGTIADPPRIIGHRDNPRHPNATSCPGDYLYAELPTIRARVSELLASPIHHPPIEENQPVLRYFTVRDQPSTLWATTDELVAVRIEGHTAAARGVDPAAVPVMSAGEADRFVFLNGLPSLSVK